MTRVRGEKGDNEEERQETAAGEWGRREGENGNGSGSGSGAGAVASGDREIPGEYIDPRNIYDPGRRVAIHLQSTVRNAQSAYKITLETEILGFTRPVRGVAPSATQFCTALRLRCCRARLLLLFRCHRNLTQSTDEFAQTFLFFSHQPPAFDCWVVIRHQQATER